MEEFGQVSLLNSYLWRYQLIFNMNMRLPHAIKTQHSLLTISYKKGRYGF